MREVLSPRATDMQRVTGMARLVTPGPPIHHPPSFPSAELDYKKNHKPEHRERVQIALTPWTLPAKVAGCQEPGCPQGHPPSRAVWMRGCGSASHLPMGSRDARCSSTWSSPGRRWREEDPVQTSSPSMASQKGTGGALPLSPVLFWLFFAMAKAKTAVLGQGLEVPEGVSPIPPSNTNSSAPHSCAGGGVRDLLGPLPH